MIDKALVSMTGEIAIVIQARMQSTRLPGKVLHHFSNGSTILDRIVGALKSLGLKICIATSNNPSDDEIADWADSRNVILVRGDERNVLSRFIQAAEVLNATSLIRVCADNPFLEVSHIETYLAIMSHYPDADYISYKNFQGLPCIKTHWGVFTELCSVKALKSIQEKTDNIFYKEHVTNYLYEHQNDFKIHLIDAPNEIIKREDLRYTVDDIEDFKTADQLIELLTLNFDLTELVSVTDNHPQLKKRMLRNIKKYSK